MKESQRKINEYKGRLPRMKEKVIAFALLLAMSASVLTMVSFAWLALSTNPEVSGVNTSIASNGNLEIALATGNWGSILAPEASQVGDSNLDVLKRNLTWGNLINLSDPRYGLDKLVLRPALLNTFGLSSKPLYGPVYDSAGRVVDMNTNFGYSAWDEPLQRFSATDELGVRAITSMTYGESGNATLFNAKLDAIEAANSKLQNNYQSIAYNDSYMDSLSAMMAGYMVKNVFKKNDNLKSMISYSTIKGTHLDDFMAMYQALIECYEEQADVFAQVLNLQAELNAKKNNQTSYATISGEELLAMEYSISSKTAYTALKNRGNTAASGGFVVEIDQFISDYQLLKTDIEKVGQIRSKISGSVTWDETSVPTSNDGTTLDTLISRLVDVNTCTITGGDYTNVKVGNIGGTIALNLLNSGDICQTYITNGVLYRFDNRSGARLKNKEGEHLSLSVSTVLGSKTIKSNVATSAKSNYFDVERVALENVISTDFGEPDLIANDSYGFAIDFWVRTNAGNSYLTLQGNVLTKTEMVRVTGKGLDGKTVEIYTITVETESEEADPDDPLAGMLSTSYDVYLSTKEDEETGETVECWRFADNHDEVTEEYLNGQTPREKYKEVEYVIGYEGDNRVWEGDQHSILTVNSTTQGSGSCYVFYSESPVDQARSLELLKSMRVAFIDENGKLLAEAYMDTERCYETSGKVIVPLVLDDESVVVGTNADGDPIRAITALEQNVPTLITALVYLDGTNLTNDDVLASADIEGQMNIQFGSSAPLHPLDNETLYNSELYAEAVIEGTKFNYDEGTDMTSHVKVTVTGTQPKSLEAFFIRQINATQGSKEDVFILTDEDGDGVWKGDYTFKYPGTYILRSVQIDGADHELKLPEGESSFPSVIVEGFTIESVSYTLDSYVMTSDSSYSGNVTLRFASDDIDKMPSTVVGTFQREDGSAANVNFAYDATQGLWRGRANFISSGVYTMQYVKLDGIFRELVGGEEGTEPSLGQWGQWFVIDVTLGMRVRVTTTVEPLKMFFDTAPETLPIQVEILDNTGNPIIGLGGASLTYSMTGTNTLHTKLLWNSSEEHYEGYFYPASGTWSFKQVDIVLGENTNTILAVNSNAPVFTIIPPEPPEYDLTSGDKVQYNDKGANASVSIYYAEAARVFGKFVELDKNGNIKVNAQGNPNVVLIEGNRSTLNEEADLYLFTFTLPDEGIWKFESVSIFDMFDTDQVFHEIPADGVNSDNYDTGIVFDDTNGFEQITIVALKEIKVTLSYDMPDNALIHEDTVTESFIFGKDDSNKVVAEFMQEYNIPASAIKLTVSDSKGLVGTYFKIDLATIEYKYGNQNYGGYTSSAWAGGTTFKKMQFAIVDGSNTFSLAEDFTLQYATDYKFVGVEIEIVETEDNSRYTISHTAKSSTFVPYNFEVYSIVPTVAISAISPTGTFDVDTTGEGEGHSSATVPAWTSTNATVYFKCSRSGSGSTCDPYRHNYSRPSVTIKLTGIGKASGASMTFGSDIHLYNGTTKTNTYTWSSDTTCARNVGYYRSRTAANDNKTPAGTISSNTLIFTYDGVEFSFTVPTITINNPY